MMARHTHHRHLSIYIPCRIKELLIQSGAKGQTLPYMLYMFASYLPPRQFRRDPVSHYISRHRHHCHSTDHAIQSKLTLPRRRQHIEKLRVENTMGCRVERDAPAGYARPLIEPYVQFSRIRLSVWDWFHQFRFPSPLGSVSH